MVNGIGMLAIAIAAGALAWWAQRQQRPPIVPDNEVTFWKQYAAHVNEACLRPRANHIKD